MENEEAELDFYESWLDEFLEENERKLVSFGIFLSVVIFSDRITIPFFRSAISLLSLLAALIVFSRIEKFKDKYFPFNPLHFIFMQILNLIAFCLVMYSFAAFYPVWKISSPIILAFVILLLFSFIYEKIRQSKYVLGRKEILPIIFLFLMLTTIIVLVVFFKYGNGLIHLIEIALDSVYNTISNQERLSQFINVFIEEVQSFPD